MAFVHLGRALSLVDVHAAVSASPARRWSPQVKSYWYRRSNKNRIFELETELLRWSDGWSDALGSMSIHSLLTSLQDRLKSQPRNTPSRYLRRNGLDGSLSILAVGYESGHYAHLPQTATGVPFTGMDLISTGERIYNLERIFNARDGFIRKDDSVPVTLLETSLQEGHSLVQLCLELAGGPQINYKRRLG